MWARQMRVKMSGKLGACWPDTARVLIDHFDEKCKDRLRIQFQVDGLPPSLNHQYEEGLSFCKQGTPGSFVGKDGRWRVRNRKLTSEALNWRSVLIETMGDLRGRWRPMGVTAAMLLFESPYWLTGKRMVREMDADNKTKPTLDAVQRATDVPDELHWQIHVFKVLSKRQRTTLFLYDLGDVVGFFY